MPIISSYGQIQALSIPTRPTWSAAGNSLNLYGSYQTYASIYSKQPNVRTVVDFLARNIAQIGLHVFRRVSDHDRIRLADHPLANLLYSPNPSTTRYRFFENLMGDLGVYFGAYWLKVRQPSLTLVRLPPEAIQVSGGLVPVEFHWQLPNGEIQHYGPEDIVHFGGYNPNFLTTGLVGLSPLETLRRILAEEAAAGAYRESYWRNSARIEGVITRPASAPKWTPPQQAQFRDQWTAKQTGEVASGKTAILEDGMDFTPTSFSAKDSEYLSSRKLTTEEVARAFHIPLPMVGILDHATFSNIKEQHKQLYVDCLGPWLVMIGEEIERQLLPEFDDIDRVYVEFNINEKLKGDFEEQAAAMQSLVGRPVMTLNEGRARLNLPSMADPKADEVAMPLNMGVSSDAPPLPIVRPVPVPVPAPKQLGPAKAEAAAAIVNQHRQRQHALLTKVSVPQRAATFFVDMDRRWNRELADDLAPLLGEDDAWRCAVRANFATLTTLEQVDPE